MEPSQQCGSPEASVSSQPTDAQDQAPSQPQKHDGNETVTIQKIQALLKTKDDTSRFAGLALLKSVLDNSPQLREDEAAVIALWQSVSPKFLDRLLRSGSKKSSSNNDARNMIDIAVAVLHTFSLLLPELSKKEAALLGRIPTLVAVTLHSSNDTTELILQTLLTIVNSPEGAVALLALEDLSPLVEIAPSQPLVLEVFLFAYVHAAMSSEDKSSLRSKLNKTISSLVASFKGTDAVTLLTFLDQLLRRVDLEITPTNPSWLKTVITYIRNLVTSKPTASSRAAYTNLSATLLQLYPAESSRLLFSDGAEADKPFSYLFLNLSLVDLRASFPALLGQLNNPGYEESSRRLASAFDVVSAFIGFLIRMLDDEDLSGPLSSLMMAPELLLKLRTSISETLSLAMEYLRDRWDASVAGAMGLHPDARVGPAKTSQGTHLTLAWDSKIDSASQDPLVLAALRTLAIWLREDDNDTLRKEAAGLCDMLVDLYKTSASGRLDFRSPVLVALEGIITLDDGVASLLANEGWEALSRDMLSILQNPEPAPVEAQRGIEIIRVLLSIVEGEQRGAQEAWLAVVTAVAAWDVPEAVQSPTLLEFQVAVLQLVTALLMSAHPSVQKRYIHSISAVVGIAERLEGRAGEDDGLLESLRDVEGTLGQLR